MTTLDGTHCSLHIMAMKTNIHCRLPLVVALLMAVAIGSLSGCQSKQSENGADTDLGILFQVKLRNQFDIFRTRTEGVYPDSVVIYPNDVVQPIWSPDRTRFVFAGARDDRFDLAIADSNGANMRFLTSDTANNFNIASWFPDGNKIVFASDREGTMDIYALNLEEPGVARIVGGPDAEWHPIITPDGRRMLFVSDRTGRPRIWVMDFPTNQQVLVMPPDSMTAEFEPAISPDGKFLAFSRATKDVEGFDIFLYNLVDETLEQLTTDPAMDRWPRFSRDGTQILFHSLRTGTPALHVYDRATKTVRVLNTGAVNSSFGDW